MWEWFELDRGSYFDYEGARERERVRQRRLKTGTFGFDDVLGALTTVTNSLDEAVGRHSVDENSYVFEKDLPGVKASELTVEINHDQTVITIAWKPERRKHGSTSLNVGAQKYDLDNVKATLIDGVLTVTVPKRHQEKREARRLTVETS